MLAFFYKPDLWLVLVTALWALRRLVLFFSAEQGRKLDLVKKLYKANTDFHLSVLIPYTSYRELGSLLELLKALDDQEYPNTRVAIHIAATPEGAKDLDANLFRPNVKVWVYQENKTRQPLPMLSEMVSEGKLVRWLIDRCLALGGSGLFVFLKPTDIVKADFFQNIVARAFDTQVMQGYMAIKYQPHTILGKVTSLATRLTNRLSNAGRFHLGMGCNLMDSGWVIKQDILERIPYRRGEDIGNLEYTLRLNLSEIQVAWAPNVVIYGAEQNRYTPYLTKLVGTFFNRLSLLLRYGPQLLIRAISRMDVSYLEQFFAIIKPPVFVAGCFAALMALLTSVTTSYRYGEAEVWGLVLISMMVLEAMGLLVSRAKTTDYLTLFVYTPLVYAKAFCVLPLVMVGNTANTLAMLLSRKRGGYRHTEKTRFNEAMEPETTLFDTEKQRQTLIRDILHGNLGGASNKRASLPSARSGQTAQHQHRYINPQDITHSTAALTRQSHPQQASVKEWVKVIPLSNGSKQVPCTLKTRMQTDLEKGVEHYDLTLEYKAAAFKTASYRILDQAYYELLSKLKSRGLVLMSCGSCGNFYNPTADMTGTIKNSGVCLFGKEGKDVNLAVDAVTVLSQACDYHCAIEQREAIVQNWRDSLAVSELVR